MSGTEPTAPMPTGLREAVGSQPGVLARAPGRANLIGEHTDYNDGHVLPAALDLATWVAGERRDGALVLRSLEEPGEVRVDLATGEGPQEGWGRYATAVVRALHDHGVAVRGLDGWVTTQVPVGAGLSSSAAFEVALAAALAEEVPAPLTLARIAQHAESVHVGVRCGIMDQLASTAGAAGQAVWIDCRDLSRALVPVPDDLALLVIDSGVSRGLADSAYNERRAECERAARALGVAALRDATLEDVEAAGADLDPVARARARHVVSEHARVGETVTALRAADHAALARLFHASHESLRADYEVSSPELDLLVSLASATDGVVASRLTGAGFGGCTISLAEAGRAEAAGEAIAAAYEPRSGRRARWWVTRPGAGAARLRG